MSRPPENAEPCYCRRCKGRNAVCPYVIRNFWRTVKCWITLNHIDPGISVRDGRCKRCGMKVLPSQAIRQTYLTTEERNALVKFHREKAKSVGGWHAVRANDLERRS